MLRKPAYILLVTLNCFALSILGQMQLSCFRELRNPLPTGRICGKYGTLKNPQNYATLAMIPLASSQSTGFYFDYCANQCQEYNRNKPCGSFSVNYDTGICKLYTQDLSKGFTKKQATSGPYFYENACTYYFCRSVVVDVLTDYNFPTTDYDDEHWLVTIPFMLPFGQSSYNKIWISMNGFISFGESNEPGAAYANVALPTSTLPPVSLAVFWDDLAASIQTEPSGDTAFIQQVSYGYSPDHFTVTWDLRNRNVANGFIRSSLYLYPNPAYSVIIYDFVDSTNGSSATVGLQADGKSFTYSYNTASIHPNLALTVDDGNYKLCTGGYPCF